MNDYALDFAHYCWQGNEYTAPECDGIYCVYSCIQKNGRFFVDELLYIGKSDNLQRRLKEHTDAGDYSSEVRDGKKVFYSWAEYDGRSLDACEAAMVYHFKPRYNIKLKDSFSGHAITSVSCSGKWALKVSGSFMEVPTT